MGQFAIEWLQALWMVLVESGPYLLVGFVIAGILSILVPAAWIARRLGGDDVKSVATAALIGVPVPLCSCSVIPTAMQLRRSGASRGATTSFLISTPETGVDSIGATWALMDPLMTVVRPVAAFMTAFASGVAVNLFGKDGDASEARPLEAASLDASPASEESELTDTEAEGGSCCSHTEPEPAPPTSCHSEEEHSVHAAAAGEETSLVRRVLNYAFGTLLDDLTPWFLIGFAISGLIVVAVPDGFFAGTLFSGWTAMLAMLIAGMPLYVCATASTPIAAAMMAKGLEPGAALVFLLAGPATNVATILVVRDLLGKRALWIYLASIAVMSLLIGSIVNALYPAFGLDPTAMDVTPGAMEHGVIATVSGVVLAGLLLRSAWRLSLGARFGRWLRKVGAPIGLDLTSWPAKVAATLFVGACLASTSVTGVAPGETVFVERFGRIVAERSDPGLVTHLPWPLRRITRVETGTIRTVEFGVATPAPADLDVVAMRARRTELNRARAESEMMTGDERLVSIKYAVQYRVTNARRWAFGASDPEALFARTCQESIRRSTATRSVQEILIEDDGEFAPEIERRLRERLRTLKIGAELVSVQLLNVHAPNSVHTDYRAVASALVDKETQQIIATRRGALTVSKARIAAAQEVRDAMTAKELSSATANGMASAFSALNAADRESGGVVRVLVTLEAMRRAFANNGDGRTIVAVPSPNIEVIRTSGAPSEAARQRSERAAAETEKR